MCSLVQAKSSELDCRGRSQGEEEEMLRSSAWRCLILGGVLVAQGCTEGPNQPTADMVLRGGVVYLADSDETRTTALALSGNQISAVGSDAEISGWIGPDTRVVELDGRLVTPGMNDAHLHLGPGGLTFLRVRLQGTTSVDEIEQRVRAAADEAEPGEWIRGRGWDHTRLPASELGPDGWPRMAVLDRAAPDHPVVLRRIDGHTAWLNSRAIEVLGYGAETPDPPGGSLGRDPATGELTGILIESAFDTVDARIGPPSAASRKRGIELALEMAAQSGLTSVQTQAVDEDMAIYAELRAAGALTLRIYGWLPLVHENIERYAREGVVQASGDAWLRSGLLKGYSDGTLGSRSAWMLEPFSDDASTSGVARYTPEELRSLVGAADSAGLQVMVHAIGDRANRVLLDTYARLPASDRPRRHRVEHAQILHPDDIPRFAEIGVVASMQPTHATSDMRWVEDRIGAERAERGAYAWRSLLDAGAALAFGTDFAVEPMSPIEGLFSAVTRQSREEPNSPPGGWLPDQRLTMEEAIRAYSAGSAYAEFQENVKGTLEPGMLADLVVWDRNLLVTPPEELLAASPDMTVVDGRIVFER